MNFYRNILTRIYLKTRKLNRLNYYKMLKKRDDLTFQELKEIQWKNLKKLVEHCYANIPYYKELFDKNGIHPKDILCLEDYAKIPPITKKDIVTNCEKLIDPTLPNNQIRYDSTSGSTGIPLRLARSKEDQEYGFAIRNKSNSWCGWDFFDRSVWIVSDTRKITEINKFKGKLRLWILNRLVLDTKKITATEMKIWAEQIKSFKPKQVYGYSSLLAEFSKFIVDNNIDINGIQGVFSTSETLTKRSLISQAFKAPVYDQYGASEIPCIAHECKNGNMHLNIDEVLVEFVALKSGSEIQKMIVTPLYLYGMPLLRYDLQDAAIQCEKTCDCGLNYPVMELKIGRVSDNILSPSGKLIPAVTLSWYMVDATKGVDQYEIIQEKIDNFTVRLVSEEKYKVQNEDTIKKLIVEMLDTNNIISFKFEYPEKISAGKNGKYRPISSKVAMDASLTL